jgi:hypothetical protein
MSITHRAWVNALRASEQAQDPPDITSNLPLGVKGPGGGSPQMSFELKHLSEEYLSKKWILLFGDVYLIAARSGAKKHARPAFHLELNAFE